MLDILIVGSGPAGLSASIYAKRAGFDVKIVEKIAYGIGQVALSHKVDNYPGFIGINGFELGMKFREHATELGVDIIEGEVSNLEFSGDRYWKVTLDNEEIIEAKAIIYATGAKYRNLEIPGEKEMLGKGVSYCATCDGAFFRGKDVAVIGGGNTALDDALYLADICNKVYLVHRRDEFRGSKVTVNKVMQRENIEVILSESPKEIEGDDLVSKLVLNNRTLDVNAVFIAVGMIPVTQILKGIAELDEWGYVKANEDGVTCADGLFVAGDVRTKELRQIITAVSDGANAATSAERYLRSW